MINKKLKSYLQYKIVHPRPNDNQQTLLKLKALQKSREKSRQKSHEKTISDIKSKKFSQSLMETTESTFFNTQSIQKSRQNTRSKEKNRKIGQNQEKFVSIDKQIKLLQSKVDILLCDKDIAVTPQQISKRAYSSSQQKKKRHIKNNSQLFANQKLNKSFLNAFEDITKNKQQPLISIQNTHRYLITIQMQACKLLTNLQIDPSQINYFESGQSLQQVFYTLQNVLSINIAKRLLQIKHKTAYETQQQLKSLHIQLQGHKIQSKFLQNQLTQIQHERQTFMQRTHTLAHKNQQLETQIFQLKSLYQQSQNNLLKANLQIKQIQKKHKNSKIQYQTQIYSQLNKLQNQQNMHIKLKTMINDQINKNKELKLNRNLLINKIQQIERDYIKLNKRHEIQKSQKFGIQQQRDIQIQIYQQYHEGIKQAYFGLIDQLSQQINKMRQNQHQKQQQIKKLKNKIKQTENRVNQFQQDYLCLNDDYTKAVKEWVTKQQHYEKTIKQIRGQLVEMHETIAQYSKMLASGKSSSRFDSTQIY